MNTNMMNTFEETINLLKELISQELSEATIAKFEEIKSDFNKKSQEIKEVVLNEEVENSVETEDNSSIDTCKQLIQSFQLKIEHLRIKKQVRKTKTYW